MFTLLFLIFVASLMAISACASPPPPPPMPMLTEEEALKIVDTYIGYENSQIKAMAGYKLIPSGGLPFANCHTLKRHYQKLYWEASYKNNGKWTVEVGSCLFIVDDYTGKVTGP